MPGPDNFVEATQTVKQPRLSAPRKSNGQSSCDACKLRRVRCERADETATCSKCIDRGIRCVTTGDRRRKQVKAARVEPNGSLPGEKSRFATSTSLTRRRSSSATTSSQSDARKLLLSNESSESALALSELVGQLSFHLIELYFEINKFPIPLCAWADFRKEFHDSGRRPELMSPMAEVLAATLIAYGARASNAPALVGMDAPTLLSVDRAEEDFIYYGRRRNAVCSALTDRAVRLADERGTFRLPSKESIVVLLMLEILVDHGDSTHKEGQPYRAAVLGHARSLAEDISGRQQLLELQESAMGWIILFRDTLQAACSGRMPRLHDDDIALLCKRKTGLVLPEDGSFELALSGQIITWDGIWHYHINLVRSLAIKLATVTDPESLPLHLKHRSGTEEAIWDVYRKLEECRGFVSSMQTMMMPYIPRERPERYWFTLGCHAMRLECILIVFVAHRAIIRELQKLDGHQEMGGEAVLRLEGRKSRLLAVQMESDKRMRHAARDLAWLLWSMQGTLGSRAGLGITGGVHILPNECFQIFAELLCNLQTSEEGGPEDYVLDTKIQEVGWLLSSFRLLGWAWPDLGETIAYVGYQYAALKDLRGRLLARNTASIYGTTSALTVDQFWDPGANLDAVIPQQAGTAQSGFDELMNAAMSSYGGFANAFPTEADSADFAWPSVIEDQFVYGPQPGFDEIAFHSPVPDRPLA